MVLSAGAGAGREVDTWIQREWKATLRDLAQRRPPLPVACRLGHRERNQTAEPNGAITACISNHPLIAWVVITNY
jgi:hypothetical protein